MKEDLNLFGKKFWENITEFPLGSLSKRELELIILKNAIEFGLAERHPAKVAEKFRISLSKANSYLTDLSLRSPNIEDREALKTIGSLLVNNEILISELFFSIPINSPEMRIWFERKIAFCNLNPGETIRKDLVKITPSGLCRILDYSTGILTPNEAIKILSNKFKNEEWIKEAKKNWKTNITWQEALELTANATTVLSSIGIMKQILSYVPYN